MRVLCTQYLYLSVSCILWEDIDSIEYIPRVNLTWRAVKGCVTKILSMGPQELIEVAQP